MSIKKIIFALSILFVISSCAKKDATLEVINETDCIYKLYDGKPTAGEFLGNIGANQTASYTFSHDNGIVNKSYGFVAESSNCTTFDKIQEFQIFLYTDETRTITIR